MTQLTLHLLGAPRAECGDAPLITDTRKATALLAYLAVTAAGHTRDAVATLLWPDLDQTRARAALRRTLSSINAACDASWLLAAREHLALAQDGSVWCDVTAFQAALAECRSHGHPPEATCERCLAPLARAAELYADHFMAGFSLRDSVSFDDWQFFTAEGLRRDLAGLLERLVNAHTARHQWSEAIAYGRRWLALDPLHEPAHRRLMLLYAWSGERAAALRQYQVARDVLHRELEVAPLPETEALYAALREHREPQPPARAAGTAQSPPPALSADAGSQAAAPAESGASGASAPTWPLVGRDAERARVQAIVQGVRTQGTLLLLEGEAGIGKTRLAECLAAELEAQGLRVARSHCYQGELELAYAPVIQLLRAAAAQPGAAAALAQLEPHRLAELRRLVPELAGPAPDLGDADAPGARTRLFEAIAHALHVMLATPGRPGLLIVDDVHWADHASLDVIAYLVNRLTAWPLVVMLTLLSGEPEAEARVQRLLAEAQRRHLAQRLKLKRLDGAAVLALVQAAQLPGAEQTHAAPAQAHSAPAQAPDALQKLAARLHQAAEGLPFFVVEYLEALRVAQAGRFGMGEAPLPQPERVRDLMRTRLAHASEPALQLLATAAVIGRSFGFETVRTASGRSDDEALASLEELLARGLVRELDDGAFDFSHEQLRAVVYDDISLTRRRLLHRRVAEALLAHARLEGRDAAPLAATLGHHYELAAMPNEAATAYFSAGVRAADLYANHDAAVHLRKAAALGFAESVALQSRLGDVEALLGNYAEAIAHYTAARAALGRPRPLRLDAAGQPPDEAAGATPRAPAAETLALLMHKQARVCHRLGEYTQAAAHTRAALEVLPADSHALRSQLLADAALTAHRQGERDEALERARAALQQAELAATPAALAHAQTVLCHLARISGQQGEALAAGFESVAVAEELDDPPRLIAALNALALAHATAANPARALPLLERAIALCVRVGDRHSEAALHNNLADALHQTGAREPAMEELKRAVTIFAEIGSGAGLENAAIWQLTEW